MNKKCTKCSQEKSLDHFFNSSYHKGGYSFSCKQCNKNYRLNNRNRIKETNRIRYLKNKEQHSTKAKAYYQKNKEKIKARQKEWYYNNREFDIARKTQWYKDNLDKGRANARKGARKRRAIKVMVKEDFKDEKIIRTLFSDQCYKCGSKDRLELDHHYPLN